VLKWPREHPSENTNTQPKPGNQGKQKRTDRDAAGTA